MKIFDAVIQGIVQGLTEFLPISSSGHLLISQHILGIKENNLFFNVMLHLGTLIAVFAVYYKLVIRLVAAFFNIVKNIFMGKFRFKDLNDDENMVLMLVIGLIPLFLLFFPVPGSGTNIKGVAEDLAGDKNIVLVGVSLIITSILIKKGISKTQSIKLKYSHTREGGTKSIWDGRKTFRTMDAIWVGVTQFIAAVFPGLSRSGSTLSVGLMRGINRQTALDYSFILGMPAIVAAAALELKDASETGAFSPADLIPVLVGMAVSAFVGFLSIILFKWLLKTNKMMIFVVYTFVVGLAAIIIGILEQFEGVNIFTGIPL